jgi:hypothetical protein
MHCCVLSVHIFDFHSRLQMDFDMLHEGKVSAYQCIFWRIKRKMMTIITIEQPYVKNKKMSKKIKVLSEKVIPRSKAKFRYKFLLVIMNNDIYIT